MCPNSENQMQVPHLANEEDIIPCPLFCHQKHLFGLNSTQKFFAVWVFHCLGKKVTRSLVTEYVVTKWCPNVCSRKAWIYGLRKNVDPSVSRKKKCIKKSEFMTTLLIGTVFSYVSYKNMSCSINICITTAQNLQTSCNMSYMKCGEMTGECK